MHNRRINTVLAVCALRRSQSSGISYACERIIRGVASGPAAGPDSATHVVILSLTHIIHADIKLFFFCKVSSLPCGKETRSGAKTQCPKTLGPSPWTRKKPQSRPRR